MWDRISLKQDSRTLLRLNYWPFVLVAFVHALVTGGAVENSNGWRIIREFRSGVFYDHGHSGYAQDVIAWAWPFLGIVATAVLGATVIGLLLNIFVLCPLEVGCKRYMTMAREVKPWFGEMGFAFRNCYTNIVKTMFLRDLYLLLWSLLLIVPGIIKSYEYRMVPYLLGEFPDMAPSEAFRISREMMTGNKGAAFVLDLSFLGWNFLSAITAGIVGLFYVGPYKMLTDSALYLVLKQENPSVRYAKPM